MRAVEFVCEIFFYGVVAWPVFVITRWLVINAMLAAMLVAAILAFYFIAIYIPGKHSADECAGAHLNVNQCDYARTHINPN